MNNKLVKKYYDAAMKRPERIRSRRKQLELSHLDVSKITGINTENIVRAEVGSVRPGGIRVPYRPKILPMCQIAVALRTTPAWLEYGVFSIESFDTELKELTKRLQNIDITERKDIIAKIHLFLDTI